MKGKGRNGIFSKVMSESHSTENVTVNCFPFLRKKNNPVVCCDINCLMKSMNLNHGPTEWRLFTDSSKLSLKAVLLHNDNLLSSIPVGHAVHMKETYANMTALLDSFKYHEHKWKICGDLKVIAILLGSWV